MIVITFQKLTWKRFGCRSSTRSCKRDVLNEKQTISELGEELKQELKAEMEFQPPIVASR